MKKAIAWLLAMMVALCASGAWASVAAAQSPAISTINEAGDNIGIQEGTQIVVGSTTKMSGHFGTELWGSDTSDLDVRSLLHGYPTVAWTHTLGLTMNATVVEGVETVEEADGSRTYTIHLNSGLTYNDGTAISAKDYVFSILLNGSSLIKEIGGTPMGMNHIDGYKAYQAGSTNTIAGVRLVSENVFSIHVSAEYLPFFYGLAMLNINPYPISVIAPGCTVEDDGSGAYVKGTFTAEVLAETLLNPQTGYEYAPKVTCGPYSLESHDAATGTATFTINGRFKGNYEGQTPHIERLELRHVQNETMITQLASGELDLVNKVSNPEAIAQGQNLALEQGEAQVATYLRSGFTFLAFACGDGPTASVAVRRAVAMSLDKDALMGQVAGGTARRVYGYYGLGQWMATYTAQEDAAMGQSAITMQEELAMLDVPMDIDGAIALLESDGWTLNASGDPFTAGTDTMRYRQGDAGLEALELRWAKVAGNQVADLLEQMLSQSLPQIGIGLSVTEMSFNDVLQRYFEQDTQQYNLFYLANNFMYVFDPYYDFNTDEAYQGVVNASGLRDDKLMQLALDMRETPSSDMYGYAMKWLLFQQRFVELMPMVPLYSNVYFDFYSNDLRAYDIVGQPGWGFAIPYAYIDAEGSIPVTTIDDATG